MKYYVIAGEASGDLNASNLVKEIFKLDKDARIRAWGGDLMSAAGAEVVKHYRDLAFMGFTEVIKNLPAILGNLKFCKKRYPEFPARCAGAGRLSRLQPQDRKMGQGAGFAHRLLYIATGLGLERGKGEEYPESGGQDAGHTSL